MKKKHLIAVLGMSLVMSLAISGCASVTENTSGQATSTEAVATEEEASTDAKETEAADITTDEIASPADGQMPGNGETPPELPDGQAPAEGEAPPELPDGEMPADGERPEMPGGGQGGPGGQMNGERPERPGSTASGESDQAGPGGSGQMGGGPGGQASQPESYEAAQEYSGDMEVSGKTINSTGTDENAVLVDSGASVTLSKMTLTRDSDDSTGGDSASFYGVGAAALVTDGTMTISGSTITTDASGGAGVFAYGDGTAYVSDTTITTEQGASGGIHVAGGGTLYAEDLTVETNGASSAAIRSDRGGGTMEVDGGSYTSNGSGSPAIYSTADITVKNADLMATGAEAICIEGLNSVTLEDCDLTGNMPDDEQNDCTWNVILYQSMSGDSEIGNSTFSMKGGSLTANNGGMFYTTNTESTFVLEDVDITYAKENDFFLKATGNSNARGWGESGSNGAQCTFTAIDQEMEGDVIWDSISTLDFSMTDESTLKGAFIQDESNAGNGGNGYANLTIDKTSKWIVTEDSVLTDLVNWGTIVDASGKTVTIKGTDGTVYEEGTGNITVTVSSYSTK